MSVNDANKEQPLACSIWTAYSRTPGNMDVMGFGGMIIDITDVVTIAYMSL